MLILLKIKEIIIIIKCKLIIGDICIILKINV